MSRPRVIYIWPLLLASTVCWSAPTLDLDPVIVGTWSPPASESPKRLTVSDSYALVSTGTNGVRVIDVSNPRNPHPVEQIPTSNASDVSVAGNHLYIADGDGGLKIFEGTNIESRNLISTLSLSNCLRLEVAPPYVYVARGALGVTIVDVSDPANPQAVGAISVRRYVEDVAVFNNYAYVATWDGLVTLDVTNPAEPHYATTNSLKFYTLLTHSNHLYAASGELSVFDLSVPTNPVYVTGRFWGSDEKADMDLRDGHLLVTDLTGTHVFDVGQAANPQRVAFVDGWTPVVALRWPYLYSATRNGGGTNFPKTFIIADLNRPANPQRATLAVSSNLFPSAIALSGDYAYMINSDLEVYDARDRLNPVRVHSQDFSGSDLAVSGQRLYAGWDYGSRQLSIYSLTNPAVPIRIGFTQNWYFADMVASSNWLFISWVDSLAVLDATDPRGIREVARVIGLPGSPRNLKLSGSLLCFGWYDYGVSSGFVLLDVSDPTNPWRRGTFMSTAGFGPGGLAFGGNFVCFSGQDRVEVVDITAPDNPRLIGFLDGVSGGDLLIREQYLYATGQWLSVVDLSDLARPMRVGGNAGFESRSLLDANNVLYCVGGYGTHLSILDPFQPLRLALSAAEAGGLQLSVGGPPRQSFRIQTSADTVHWADWATASSQSSLPITSGPGLRFYRAVWP